ncbi:MAG: hypothetical protein FJZ94_02185 [Chloroflexi bacterium]|nr:hypothetical protein [Chloroflexota bacterium]
MNTQAIQVPRRLELLLIPIILGAVVFVALLGSRNPVLSIALPGVLLWGLIGILKPRVTFFLFLALLPFVDFLKRLQLVFTNPSSLEWNLVLALPDILFLITTTAVVLRRALAGRLTVRVGKTDWWLLAFLVSMLVSVVHSAFPLVVGMSAFKLSGFYVLAYFLAPALITKEGHLRLLLKMTFMLSTAVALYGLWQQAFGMTSFEERWLIGGYTGLSAETIIYFAFRPFSTLNGPQAYAYYLAIGLILGLAYVRSFVPRNNRGLWYVGAFIIMIALGLSLTRSAILFVVLTWALAKAFSTERRLRHPVRLALLLAFSVVSLVLVLLRFGDVIQSMALSSGVPFVQRAFVVGTLGDRLMGWRGVITNPAYWTLLGYGLGTTNFTLMHKYGSSFDLFSHDEYSDILLEQGVIGVFLFIGFVVLWMRDVYRRIHLVEGRSLKLVGWSLFALCFSILVIGLLGSNLKVSPINVYFWLMAGLLVRSTAFASSRKDRRRNLGYAH